MNAEQKHAIIISLEENITEITQLAETLGYTILKDFIQHREIPDVNYYIGSGKIDEIKDYLDSLEKPIDLIIINGELKPSQWFILEKKFGVTVDDRVRLILAIFEEHAERREAQLQVKLAQLHYERPFVRELIHRAKAGEHPGLMAGGEYQVDDYYEMIKRQTKKIKEDLQKIRENRELHRQTRSKSGFYSVSLAGYTNAGKSSLMTILSGEKVKIDEHLFSTLSTTTRSMVQVTKGNMQILLTDTVGFIENLPSYIIDAFHSTLEEIQLADVVILVVDGSEQISLVEKKLQVSLNELRDMGVTAPLLIAINKIDIITTTQLEQILDALRQKQLIDSHPCIPLSAKEHIHIDDLITAIHRALPHMVRLTFHLPSNEKSQSFLSQLYEKTHVLQVTYGTTIRVQFECNEKIKEKLQAACITLKGTVS